MHATRLCWSTANSFSLPKYLFKLGENQNGKSLQIKSILSPNRRREIAVPMHPGLFPKVSATRSSKAPVRIAVRPNLDCPVTAILEESISGCDWRQSIILELPQAHAIVAGPWEKPEDLSKIL